MKVPTVLNLVSLSLCIFYSIHSHAQKVIGAFGSQGFVNSNGDTVIAPIFYSIQPLGKDYLVNDRGDISGVISAEGKWIVPLDTATVKVKGNEAHRYYLHNRRLAYGYLYREDGSLVVPEKVQWLQMQFPPWFHVPDNYQQQFMLLLTKDQKTSLYSIDGSRLIDKTDNNVFVGLGEGYPIYAYRNKSLLDFLAGTQPKYTINPSDIYKGIFGPYTIYSTDFKKLELRKPIYQVVYTKNPNLIFVKTDTTQANFELLDLKSLEYSQTNFESVLLLPNSYLLATVHYSSSYILNFNGQPILNEGIVGLQAVSRSDSLLFVEANGIGTPIAVSGPTRWSMNRTYLNEKGEKFLVKPAPHKPTKRDSVICVYTSISPDSITTIADKERLVIPQVSAEYPGGSETLRLYFHNNLKCSQKWMLLASFVIEADGSVTNTQLNKKTCINEDCCMEIESLLRNMPKWKPGTVGGNPVATGYLIAILPKYRKE